MFFRVV